MKNSFLLYMCFTVSVLTALGFAASSNAAMLTGQDVWVIDEESGLRALIPSFDIPADKPQALEIRQPSVDKEYELLNKYPSDIADHFHSDLIVKEITLLKNDRGDITGSLIKATGKFGMAMTNVAKSSSSVAVGLPGTRLEISELKKGNRCLFFAKRMWFPMKAEHAYIIVTEKKVIGVNVKIKEN